MSVVNRAVGPPWNIWSDQSDSMNQRDTGWLQVYCESNQEALDTILMGYRIAEDARVMLPVMSMEDAFILSHTSEKVDLPGQDDVDSFLPSLDLPFRVDSDNPLGYGSYSTPDGPFMELKRDMMESMWNSKPVIRKVTSQFAETFGRDYGGLTEAFFTDDADYILVASGTVASTARYVASRLRKEGKKVGVLRVRFFRPFPEEEIRKAVSGASRIGIIERSVSFGSNGALSQEIRSALFRANGPDAVSFIAGIGGRDVREIDIRNMFRMLEEGKSGNIFINSGGGD